MTWRKQRASPSRRLWICRHWTLDIILEYISRQSASVSANIGSLAVGRLMNNVYWDDRLWTFTILQGRVDRTWNKAGNSSNQTRICSVLQRRPLTCRAVPNRRIHRSVFFSCGRLQSGRQMGALFACETLEKTSSSSDQRNIVKT